MTEQPLSSALDISDYIPHRGKMCLLDQLLRVNAEQAVARTTPAPDSLFATPDGVPALVGIEYLAQTAAAYAKAQSQPARAPAMGLLLGCRQFHSHCDYFAFYQPLEIRISPVLFEPAGVSRFAGDIVCRGELLASGSVTVLQNQILAA